MWRILLFRRWADNGRSAQKQVIHDDERMGQIRSRPHQWLAHAGGEEHSAALGNLFGVNPLMQAIAA
jgi:hypothetical protein